MSYRRDPWWELISGGSGAPPRFLTTILVLLACGCIAEEVAELRPWLEQLRLSTAVWEQGELWRLVTYGFVGTGRVTVTTVLQIACVYWFGLQLCVWLGNGRGRVLMIGSVVVSSAVASAAQYGWETLGGAPCASPFSMMQGQHVMLAAVVAGFAACHRHSTVKRLRLLFGLEIPSRWLVPLQLGWALLTFANTRDFGGLVGIAIATAWGWTRARKRS